eukprot:3034189-Amphidinium_carterae.1
MTEDDIESLQKQALMKGDPEAKKKYDFYIDENQKLEKCLQEKYDKEHGSFEGKDEYKQALERKDDATIKTIIYEYAKKIRELKL